MYTNLYVQDEDVNANNFSRPQSFFFSLLSAILKFILFVGKLL
jgi:hypothetical protein